MTRIRKLFLLFVNEGKNTNRQPFPLVGESVNRQVDERGKCGKKGKKPV